jgi:hypothetical protein
LLEQFRRSRPAIPAEPPKIDPPYTFSDETLYETHRSALRFMRRLLNPILKLFFNPNPLINVLHTQAQFNADMLKREQRRKIEFDRSRAEWNALYYEVLHNLVLETTRVGIEVKNLKMRLESLQSRLDFSERRVRALEGVVQYRPEAVRPRDRQERRVESAEGLPDTAVQEAPPTSVEGGRRRRRRRRGRRGIAGQPGTPMGPPPSAEAGEAGGAELQADIADAAAAGGEIPGEEAEYEGEVGSEAEDFDSGPDADAPGEPERD